MPGRRRPADTAAPLRRSLAALGLALLLTALTGCGDDRPQAPPVPAPAPGAGARTEPGGESPFWVDPHGEAARQVAAWEAQGRYDDAQVLRRIAERPLALWAPVRDPGPRIRRAAADARTAGRTLVLALHNIPGRDCGQRPAGGARDAGAYRSWIGTLADALGDTRALVVLEPGALVHAADGCTGPEQRAERYRLLSEAVGRLKRSRRTKVYLDAGGPDRVPDPKALAEPLKRAGLARADGFALNVSGFQTDAAAREYGAALSRATGGAHFVIDTSRNGEGPLPGEGKQASCNPPGRSLGAAPTTVTGDPLVDAHLWIKRPGLSDGPCRGGPASGQWWPEYALGLARRSKEQL
ncbi:glycoside hydrolase family 6 protein [Streptomyces xanthophaeus]|uniref:glycoside hydrolase family 6 protein n=1 Tax=Streptomyces xanthophaeus TaxID=67385 RepID=UPI0004CD6683|nr:glycoside hydrolase family 6 protein [Streptomyces xanthophaeus]